MGIFVIVFAIAAVAIIVAAAKEAKKTKNAQNAQGAQKKLDETSEIKKTANSNPSTISNQSTTTLLQTRNLSDEQRVTPISSTLAVEDKEEARARARRELQARLDEYKARKAELEAKRAPTMTARATTTAQSHNQTHSSIVFKDHSKYRVEEVPVMNSIGGQSDEGCSEHYNLRYVKIDKPIIPEHLELTELQKCIVYGEIINQPAFRKNYRR
ncbi:MAG: hypothetical protein K2G37_01405 [Clostridia bacterium]|nr:hypothetical protein [Clostridia bacterium]MDE7329055.1 hypothetical protein [Clostridia bacterium]